MKSKLFKQLDNLFTPILYMSPAFLAVYHFKHHKSIELDIILFIGIMLLRGLTMVELLLSNLIKIISSPQTVNIIDKTLNMDDVDIYIRAKGE